MQNQFSRTELLLGPEAMEHLSGCRVAVFGIGGVGGYAVEGLARSGVGALDLIDNDRVGQYKVDVAEERVREINPDCRVTTYKTFYLPDTRAMFDFSQYDYVVDAIDTVTGKLALIEQAQEAGTPVISAMGAGNKLDPTAFRVTDIYKTSVCPLARIIRSECRKRGIKHLKVVYSTEEPVRPLEDPEADGICPADPRESIARRDIPGSTAFVPSVAGLIIAGEVVRDLCREYIAKNAENALK